ADQSRRPRCALRSNDSNAPPRSAGELAAEAPSDAQAPAHQKVKGGRTPVAPARQDILDEHSV
ncbi:MAG: hypothetical protein WB990_19360, partial [Candidatus Acidiferrales bacterium]